MPSGWKMIIMHAYISKLLTLCLAFLAAVSVLGDGAPSVCVPAAVTVPVIDGIVSDAEWNDAGTISSLCKASR